MDARTNLQEAIDALSAAIIRDPANSNFYLERGKSYHRHGQFDKALNDFIRVTELAGEKHAEAEGYISMIQAIFAFRYAEMYNV